MAEAERSTLQRVVAVGGPSLAVVLALVAQQLTFRQPYGLAGWALFLVAAVLIAATVVYPRPDSGAVVAAALPLGKPRALFGVAALLAVALATVLSELDRWPVMALLSWLASFALASLALRHWEITTPLRQPAWSRGEVLLLALVVVLAGLARVAWIDDVPRYVFGDEPRVGTYLWREYRQGIPNFFRMGWNTWPAIGLSLQGLFAPLMGLSTTALRLSSALMGTLAVLATYLLARHLYSRRVALLAALLLAICRTAIDFSRIGTCHAQVIFLVAFAFFWWWRGINTGRAASYLWAGIGVGLCLYTYNAGHSVPLLWAGWVALTVLLAPGTIRTHWRGVAVALAGFVISAFPWLFYVTDHFGFGQRWFEWTYMARNRQVLNVVLDAWNAGGWSAAAEVVSRQAGLTWLGFGILPADAYGLGYRGGGMLDHVTAALFVLGLAMSLPWLRGRGGFVPYWWLFTVIVGGVLTNSPPAFVRLVGLLPAVAILAALPLDRLMGSFESARRAAVGTALVVLLLAAAGWGNWRTYFVEFPGQPADEMSELVRIIRKQPPETSFFIVGSEPFLRFFNEEIFPLDFYGRYFEDVQEPAHLLPLRRPFQGKVALVLGPTQVTLARYIEALYPRAQPVDVKRDDRLLFRIVWLLPEDVAARTGLLLHAYDAQSSTVATQVADPFEPPPLPANAQLLSWQGSVYWPTDRPLQLVVNATEPVTLQLGGPEPIEIGVGEPAPVTLPRGWQPLRIEQPRGGSLSIILDEGGTARALTRWDLRPEPQQGLSAVYKRPGLVLLRTVEPHLNAYADEGSFAPPQDLPVRQPFMLSWEGSLIIEQPGTYQFEVHASSPYAISLAGTPLCGLDEVKPEPSVCQASRDLEPGSYPIVARWDTSRAEGGRRRLFQVYWTPPDGERELIPPSSFMPWG